MECVKRLNTYIYHACPQVYFNTLDHCYYQFFEYKKDVFNTNRFEVLERCNSPYTHCYLSDLKDNHISLRFSLFRASTPLYQFQNKHQLNGAQLCKIFLQLLEAVSLLHKHNTYHGNLSVKTVFINESELSISLGSFSHLDVESNVDVLVEKEYDLSQIPAIILSLIYEDNVIEDVINGIKNNDLTTLQVLSSKSSSLFVSFIHFFLQNQNHNVLDIVGKWIDLQDLLNQRWPTIETLLRKYIEFNYNSCVSKNESIIDYVHYIRPYLFDDLIFITPKPVKHDPKCFQYYMDSKCNIYDIKPAVLSSNTFTVKPKLTEKILHFEKKSTFTNGDAKNDYTTAFGRFVESHGLPVVGNTISIPRDLNKDTNHYVMFSQPSIVITLVCQHDIKLLTVANSIRSLGYAVKCEKPSNKPFQPSETSLRITISDEHYISKPNTETWFTVETSTGKFKCRCNDFMSNLSQTNNNHFHSISTLQWLKSIAVKPPKTCQPKSPRKFSISRFCNPPPMPYIEQVIRSKSAKN
ncbi:Protein kinase domain-containing protein [Entamoeba marina]